jgi:hypothetical protein
MSLPSIDFIDIYIEIEHQKPLVLQHINSKMGAQRVGQQHQLMGLFCIAFLLGLLASVCDGHSSRRLPLAGIFGNGGKKDNPQQQQQRQQQQQQQHLG